MRWTRLDSLYDLGSIVDQFHEDYRTVLPQDRKLIYPWIEFSLVEDDFEKLRNRNQIERTEDFYFGTLMEARVGWSDEAWGADRDALIFSSVASRGISLPGGSMLLLTDNLLGRLEHGTLRNGMVTASAKYYLVPVSAVASRRGCVFRCRPDLGQRAARAAEPGSAQGRRCRAALRQQSFRARQHHARGSGNTARSARRRQGTAVPGTDPAELLIFIGTAVPVTPRSENRRGKRSGLVRAARSSANRPLP
jgi:hypothetical protein